MGISCNHDKKRSSVSGFPRAHSFHLRLLPVTLRYLRVLEHAKSKEALQKLSHGVSAISPPTYSSIFPLLSVSYGGFEEKLADRVLKHKSPTHQRSRLKVKACHSWPVDPSKHRGREIKHALDCR